MNKKTKVGKILKISGTNSAVVGVNSLREHPKYKKKYKVSKKFLVHNPDGQYKTGELVEIQETRPISRKKHFKIIKKI